MIFPLIYTALFSRAITPTAPFEFIRISPLYMGKVTKIVIETKASKAYFDFFISNDVVTDKQFLSVSTSGAGKHIFAYDNSFTRTSNEIYVKYSTNTSAFLRSKTVQMNICKSTSGTINDKESITSNSVVTSLIKNASWSTVNLTYNFVNFDDTYTPDYYHKIKLSDYKINIDSTYKDFLDCEPSLIIKNVDGVFNDIAKTKSVEFPLSLKETSTGVTLQLKDKLYVDKQTLLLSKTKKEGYVETKHIYLPRNEMRNQDKFTGYLVFQNFGIDKSLLRHDFSFNALKNIVGDCQNSQFCIQRTY